MKNAEVTERAWWLVAASLAPWIIVGGVALIPSRWLETHVSIHNDAPLILLLFFLWAGATVATFIGVPWMCWRLVARTSASPQRRRVWRTAFIVGNVVACLPFLLLTISRARSRTG